MLANALEIVRDNWLLLLVGQYPQGPLGGFAATLVLSVLGIGLAFPVSIGIALARISRWPVLRAPATALVYVVRGIPLLMIIFWVYFLFPLLLGTQVSGFATMVCTLVLYEGVFLSEIVRAGIQSLPRGQMDAARALGHGYFGAMRHVILPQALYNMLPSMLSQFISTIKDTTLGYIINVPELTFAANQLSNRLLTKPFEVFLILALVYYAVCASLTQLSGLLERTVAKRRAGRPVLVEPVLMGAST
jgi:polar amino acid transport system permease protein